MQKNEIVYNDESCISNKRKEKLKKLFEYEETRENGKIVLLNNKIRLVQLTDCKEDREIYKIVTTDYNGFLKEFRGIIRTSNLDELFDEEVLHKNHEKFPLFACYNNRNELIGTFGSRNAVVIKDGNKEITLHELSGRLMQKYANSGLGAIADTVMSNYCLNHGQDFFFTSFNEKRDYFIKISQYAGNYKFLGSKKRQVDGNNVDFGDLDFYCTMSFNGLLDHLV